MVLKLLAGANEKLVKDLTIELEAEVVDLRRENVDYREVLEKIFEAESVQVW